MDYCRLGTVERRGRGVDMPVGHWTGREAQFLRLALRLSIRGFAEYLGVATRTVSRWEQCGVDRSPRPEYQAVLDTALRRASDEAQQRFRLATTASDHRDTDGRASMPAETAAGTSSPAARMQLAEPSPLNLEGADLLDLRADGTPGKTAASVGHLQELRETVHDTLAVSSVTSSGLDEWEQTVLRHGRATRYRAAGPLLIDLVTDCHEIHRLLRLRQSVSTAHRLTRIMAQMAGLMSLTLIKLNDKTASSAWGRTARLAADEAGDSAVRSWVRAQEAYTAYYAGDLPHAVEIACHAQALAGGAPCVGVALAAALEARAQAQLSRTAAAHGALTVAEAALDRLDSDLIADSAFGYNEAQLRFHEGNALTHLGDTHAARIAQHRALELYPDADYLDRALVHLDEAACLMRAGEPEAGLAEAITTLLDLSASQREGIIDSRARQVLAVLSHDQMRLPAAQHLRDTLSCPH
jgi:transcriptional regulator with XRE-family HTH domain/tetratricopeptide (TPR) repeat protein